MKSIKMQEIHQSWQTSSNYVPLPYVKMENQTSKSIHAKVYLVDYMMAKRSQDLMVNYFDTRLLHQK